MSLSRFGQRAVKVGGDRHQVPERPIPYNAVFGVEKEDKGLETPILRTLSHKD